jgi:3'-phosphoadenosine 5'-phosphosulfate sulfotransferase
VQHRLRIRGAFRDEIASLIETRGLKPLFVDEQADGTVSFCFGEVDETILFSLLQAVPPNAFALQARM